MSSCALACLRERGSHVDALFLHQKCCELLLVKTARECFRMVYGNVIFRVLVTSKNDVTVTTGHGSQKQRTSDISLGLGAAQRWFVCC